MRMVLKTFAAAMTVGLLASYVGCGQDNNKTATSGSAPGVADPKGSVPTKQDDYMNYAKQQSTGGGNPYGKKAGS